MTLSFPQLYFETAATPLKNIIVQLLQRYSHIPELAISFFIKLDQRRIAFLLFPDRKITVSMLATGNTQVLAHLQGLCEDEDELWCMSATFWLNNRRSIESSASHRAHIDISCAVNVTSFHDK